MPTLPIPDRLRGVRLKIERAKQHVSDFESRLKSFMKTEPYGVRIEEDPERLEEIQRIDIRAAIPDNFAAIVADAVLNLRTALEYLATQLILANGGTPGKSSGFPIYDSSAKYIAHKMTRIEGMSPAAINVLDAIKPYLGGNDLLWKLHELNNIEKHRMPLAPALAHQSTIIDIPLNFALAGLTPPMMIVGTGQTGITLSVLKDGAEIGRIARGKRLKDDVQFKVAFDIAFCEPPVLHGEPVVPFLHQAANAIDGVVNQFIPFL
jgi:hypothetical protein